MIVPLEAADWQDTAIAIGTSVTTLGVIAAAVGAFLAWRGIREDAKGRHAQIAVDFGRRWDSEETAIVKTIVKELDATDLALYWRAKRDSGRDEYYQLERFANYFEDLGVLNRLNILDIEWVKECLGSSVLGY